MQHQTQTKGTPTMAKKSNTEETALANRDEKMTDAEKKAAEEKAELARVESENMVKDAFDAATELLANARKLKEDDFDEVESDFFKFENEGDSIQGAYLGAVKERILQHCIGIVTKDGEPTIVRVNSTRQLGSDLSRLAPLSDGKPRYFVRLEYVGTEKTGNGRNVKKFKVGSRPVNAK
jgi:hypothetical protein